MRPLRTLWRAGTTRLRPALAIAASIALAACNQTTPTQISLASPLPQGPAVLDARYQALSDERFPVAAVKSGELDPKYARQRVRYLTTQPPGTVVVDPDAKFLYLVQEGGYAMRYGVGVGREGFGWSGAATIGRKAQWPTWTPPSEMIRRQPELKRYAQGMKPGSENPLGARALYLFQNGRDTLYRLHGTSDPSSIGQNVSSGCIRLLNQDVIDLHRRVPVGAKVVVLPHGRQT